ncbi:MAG: DeoR/GlpR transcriptional regulator [Lachnospiraceae bacterium]|nr:DeoR/GlpR transcriptional regulator [Lachnospiraceae bacterium]MBR5739512.1 DeoR/GlpR transcriptional regulator [Lachnospiraceae bacterium]
MSYYERENQILKILREKEGIGNQELAASLYVSPATLRRDLKKMEMRGYVIRKHGTCTLVKTEADRELPISIRELAGSAAKVQIAKEAVKQIQDGDVIMLDGSTSALTMVPFLSRFQGLIVITTGVKAAYMLGSAGIETILAGGRMIKESLTCIGKEATDTISRYHADLAFFSCRGLSEDGMISDNSVEQNDIRRVMMAHSTRSICLMDSTKFSQQFLCNLCPVSEVDDLISEVPLPEKIAAMLRKH